LNNQEYLIQILLKLRSIGIKNDKILEAIEKIPPHYYYNLFKSFSIMSVLTLISRILGYVRDLFFAFIFGATPLADSFLLAFRIPNFFRRLFAEGAINNAFILVSIIFSFSNSKK